MKRFLIFAFGIVAIFAAVLLPSDAALAQGQIYGQAGLGLFEQDGVTKIGMFSGGDVNILHDTAKGLSMYTRVQVIYSKFDDTYQAGAMFFMTQKRLGLVRDLYVGFGPGYYHRIQGDESDEQLVALRLNVGSDVLGGLGIDIGADYMPSVPVDNMEDETTTRWFFYGAINLYPRL